MSGMCRNASPFLVARELLKSRIIMIAGDFLEDF
jgi:hypothetical protein